ncbi:MAG TPA: hypothetical protein VJ597_03850, partial [Sphingomicrobium sp.]|nr:hypothetical protein [Sphingomicrobium sp.]
VQEHCLTLPQIKDFLEAQDLDFLGFSLRPEVRGRYSQMFPDDPSQTNLDCWHVFETQHPDTFLGMYEFWIQKKPWPATDQSGDALNTNDSIAKE